MYLISFVHRIRLDADASLYSARIRFVRFTDANSSPGTHRRLNLPVILNAIVDSDKNARSQVRSLADYCL